jgi:gpW
MATDTAVLEAQLAEAEAALHKLMMGTKVVKIGYDGADTEFSRTSVPELRRYIATLKRQLGDTSVRPGSRRVIF